MIDKGRYSFYNSYSGQLQEGINYLKNEISTCDNFMRTNDKFKYEIVNKIKNDIIQTRNRYDKLMSGNMVPKFNSSFGQEIQKKYLNKSNYSLKESYEIDFNDNKKSSIYKYGNIIGKNIQKYDDYSIFKK